MTKPKQERYERYDIPGFGAVEIWSDVPAETCANRDIVKLTSHITPETKTFAYETRTTTRHTVQGNVRRYMQERLEQLEHEAEMLRTSLGRERKTFEGELAWLKKYQTKGDKT